MRKQQGFTHTPIVSLRKARIHPTTHLVSGFTLIELLVVIAIIGILSAVVLASLNTARSKGGDAAVQADLSSLRVQAELAYSNGNCYSNTTTCGAFAEAACPTTLQNNTIFGDQTILNQITAARSAGGGLTSCRVTGNAGAYAVAVQLKTDRALAWCVDSRGQAKREGTPGGAPLNQTSINGFITSSGACL